MRPSLTVTALASLALAAVLFACGGADEPSAARIVTSDSSLAVSAVKGANPAARTITLTNGGGTTLDWTATDDADWLTVAPASGSLESGAAGTPITVSVDVSSVAPGSYTGTITLAGTAGVTSKTVTVALTVAAQPEIGLSVTTLSFSAQQGSNPASQTVSITNSGGSTLNWTVTSDAAWLTATPGSGSAPATLTVAASGTSLTAGTHQGTITIAAAGASNTPRTIAVTFTVTPPPAIGLAPATLAFAGIKGGASPASQPVSITNAGGGTLSWTATADAAWLFLSSSSGTGPATVNVSASTTGLAAGTYNGTITVAATGASNTPRTVAVTLTVTEPATIATSTTAVSFTGTAGGANPAAKTVDVTNTGASGSTLAWTASADAAWISLSPTSGTAPSTITVNASTAGLAAGTYNGTITITSAGATNSPKTVAVQLVVAPNYDGTWTGKTSQDSTITLTIANNGITQVSFGWKTTGGCTSTGRTTTSFSTPLSVSSGSFSFSVSGGSPSYSMTGTFASGTSLSGTLSVTYSPCSASSGSLTFTASKP